MKIKREVSHPHLAQVHLMITRKRKKKMITKQVERIKRNQTHLEVPHQPQVKMIRKRKKEPSLLRSQFKKRKRRDLRVHHLGRVPVALLVQVVVDQVLHPHLAALQVRIQMRKGEDVREKRICSESERNVQMRKVMKNFSWEAKKLKKPKREGLFCMKRDIDVRSLRKSTLRNMRMKYGWPMQNLNMKMNILVCLQPKIGL